MTIAACLVAACAAAVTGCVSQREYFEGVIANGKGFVAQAHIMAGAPHVCAEDVDTPGLNEIRQGRVVVAYPQTADPARVRELAQLHDRMLSTCENRLGMELMGLRLILFHTDNDWIGSLHSPVLSGEDRVLTLPVPLTPRIREFGWLERWHARTLAYFIVHEVVEATLVSPGYQPVALMDLKPTYLNFIQLDWTSHTRWFRDGLANYGAYVALESVIDGSMPVTIPVHKYPLSRLAQTGTELFRWEQHDGDDSVDAYSAALGFFLLVEEKFGPGAVARVVEAAKGVEYPDHAGLRSAVERALGVTPEQLVSDFNFPDWYTWSLRTDDYKIEMIRYDRDQGTTTRLLKVEGVSPRTTIEFERLWLRAVLQGRAPEFEAVTDQRPVTGPDEP